MPTLPTLPGAVLQAWTEAARGARGRLEWPVYVAALGASACPVRARAELAAFVRLLATGVRAPAAPTGLLGRRSHRRQHVSARQSM
jgi:hypothetical protein